MRLEYIASAGKKITRSRNKYKRRKTKPISYETTHSNIKHTPPHFYMIHNQFNKIPARKMQE